MSCENEYWRLYVENDQSIPAHIYAGVKLVATVFCHQSASSMVEQHNNLLANKQSQVAGG